MLRQNWMAASEYVPDRPGRPLDLASHSISRSSQTSKEPRRRRAALYSGQFVVRSRAGDGVLMPAQISASGLFARSSHEVVQQRHPTGPRLRARDPAAGSAASVQA